MFRKNYFLFILAIALFLAGSITAFAQTSQISGKVELKKADGTTEPVVGATVEVFRTDKKVNFDAVKTDATGIYTVSNIPNEGEYIVSVSGEKLKAGVSDIVKFGAKDVNFVITSGDGGKYSEQQIRDALSSNNETAEQKAEREKIESGNKKIEAVNATIDRTIQEGVKAFDAKNYDLAIAKFEEGYQASPDFLGSAPGMLNNKALSLVKRALVGYNTMVKDPAQKAELRPKVNKDFEDSIEAYSLSLKLLKEAKSDEITKFQKGYDANKSQALLGVQESVNLMVRTDSASEAKKDSVINLVHEYIAFEKDSKKKEAAQLDLASYLQKVYDFDNAIIEFKKAAETAPNNPDVIGGLGLALYTVAYESEGTEKKQEALNYLQLYLDIAPKDHPLRDGIEGGVADLKGQKLKPQKIAGKN